MIAEPMTMLTDYALAGVTGWLAYSLFRTREGQRARSLWALAFAALALAAALGGTWHGFGPAFAAIAVLLVWKVTVLSVGIASFGMLAGSAIATTAGNTRKSLLAVAAVKLAVYSGWMLGHSEYIYVIMDTGTALVLIAVLHLWSAARDRAARWILAGVGVSVLAAGVQALDLGLPDPGARPRAGRHRAGGHCAGARIAGLHHQLAGRPPGSRPRHQRPGGRDARRGPARSAVGARPLHTQGPGQPDQDRDRHGGGRTGPARQNRG